MSHQDFRRSRELLRESFVALMLAALERGNPSEQERLAKAFPEAVDELHARASSPDGRTSAELAFDDLGRRRVRAEMPEVNSWPI